MPGGGEGEGASEKVGDARYLAKAKGCKSRISVSLKVFGPECHSSSTSGYLLGLLSRKE